MVVTLVRWWCRWRPGPRAAAVRRPRAALSPTNHRALRYS
ncbi:hypothetical protein CPAR01_10327 [Colletotrichum paranaense]|uniref:Uncharacterized protein n=1 Tax=Colletotrichum paranaense TaxID=1914294 RepID=A0ABQ9SDQ3_9PEZI|nr:uncharacterized protein CPAR01_10327 [Colletotrichum paranaense]KAK1533619.1 hypothetical protein CPAR01_10327 [Colletotrichum paranaense]